MPGRGRRWPAGWSPSGGRWEKGTRPLHRQRVGQTLWSTPLSSCQPTAPGSSPGHPPASPWQCWRPTSESVLSIFSIIVWFIIRQRRKILLLYLLVLYFLNPLRLFIFSFFFSLCFLLFVFSLSSSPRILLPFLFSGSFPALLPLLSLPLRRPLFLFFAPSSSSLFLFFPKRIFRWVAPLKSKDFSEIEAKGRKSRFQAKIRMQKSRACVCPGFFKIMNYKKSKATPTSTKQNKKQNENKNNNEIIKIIKKDNK